MANREGGISIIEILVVIAIFAILGIIVTRAVILTVGGSKKSESLVKVRENLDFAASVIERQIRNADSIVNCPGVQNSTSVSYVDQSHTTSSFSCGGGSIASGAAQLTGSDVTATCSFTCRAGGSSQPDSLLIFLNGKDATATGIQNAEVTVSTQISLRNY